MTTQEPQDPKTVHATSAPQPDARTDAGTKQAGGKVETFAAQILGMLAPKGPWHEVTIENYREIATGALFQLRLHERPPRYFEGVALLPKAFAPDIPDRYRKAVLERAAMELGKIVELDADFPGLRALQFLAAHDGSFDAARDLGDWMLRTQYYDRDRAGFEEAGKTLSTVLMEGHSIEDLRLDSQLVVAAFSHDVDLMVAVRNRARDPLIGRSPAFVILQERLRQMPTPEGRHVVFREIAPESGQELNLTEFFDLQYKPLPLIASPDPVAAIAPLRGEFPWFESVLDRIERQLELAYFADGTIRLRPLLVHGAPGIGKNRFVRRLAKVLSLPLTNFNAGGSADSMSLKGAARGWATSRPSLAAHTIAQHGCANPLIFVDELDKEGVSRHNGRVSDVLHQLLERESSRTWYDECLLGACDFSRVNWMAAANSIQQMPSSLLSRFDVVRVPAPDREHYPGIFRNIVADLVGDYGIDRVQMLARFENLEIRYLCERAKSPRHLRRLVEVVLVTKIREMRNFPH